MKKRNIYFICISAAAVLTAALLFAADYTGLLPQRFYTAADFGIETLKSGSDFNGNGTDDYTDILLGARADAENRPRYTDKYYAGGYPPENEGVCTDLVWRAFKNAGFYLRDMVDCDIRQNPDEYPNITARDKNIDFRRVPNLKIFFDRYAQSLTVDITQTAQFQPGDIVIVNGTKHIGIISDKRNKNGVPYIIHNGGQPKREEDALSRMKITAHYRFDAQKIPDVIKDSGACS